MEIINNWKIIKLVQHGSNGKAMKYECECMLCHEHYLVDISSIRYGSSKQCKSCGYKIGTAKRKKAPNNRLKNILKQMKQRCYNPNSDCYKSYGAKGITICDEWMNDSSNFYNWSVANGYEENLTIDRIDNTKGYTPENCRWVDMKIQNNNRRCNVLYEFNGRVETLQYWCDLYKLHRPTIDARLRRGMSFIDAITIPINQNKGRHTYVTDN